MRRVLLACALLASMLVRAAASARPVSADPTRPNIVIILTDDQHFDTMWAMPHTEKVLGDHGVTFDDAFLSNPLCAPSRSSLLTGKTSGHNGMWGNCCTHGGFHVFDDSDTIATRLQDSGYRTAMIGKYLNGYNLIHRSYVPPGWSHWWALWGQPPCGIYGNPCINDDGAAVTEHGYLHSLMAHEAADTIASTPSDTPLFLYMAPFGPHEPAAPAPVDRGKFKHIDPYRPPNYNEADVSDKPDFIQRRPQYTPDEQTAIDKFRIDQLETQQSEDRMVASVVNSLKTAGRLNNTFILFMTDNGILWGEHRWDAKEVPYDEAIRTPFIVRYDPLTAGALAGTHDEHMVENLDFAPTAADLGGVQNSDMDGSSLLPLLEGNDSGWRTDVLIEHLTGYADSVETESDGYTPSFCGVRTQTEMFARYKTGEEEYYRLDLDPYELNNKAHSPKYRDRVTELRDRTRELCRPRPPDMGPF